MKTAKRIRVAQLRPGMFVVEMDQPWYKTPYLLHKRLIKSTEEITELIRHGVQEVVIDPARGLDHVEPSVEKDHAGPDQAAPPGSGQDQPAPAGSPEKAETALLPASHSCLARAVYEQAETAMERIFEDLNLGRAPAVPILKSIVGGVLERILHNRAEMMTQLFVRQMRRFDRGLSSHAIDTCILSLVFAGEYGVYQGEMEQVGIGALLHDVGYLRLPRNLFRKQQSLTQQEQDLMRQHPRLGLAVLMEAKDLPEPVRRIVVEHHERVDGSGFPSGLSGSALSSLGQLIGLVDTYMRLTGGRDGSPPLSPFEAIRELFLLGEKRHFDKTLVEVAIKCLGVYPIGSVVKLNTGERAIVVGIHPHHRLKPVLKVIAGPHGEPYASPVRIDLAEPADREPARTIQRVLDPVAEQINALMYFDNVPQEGAA